MRVTVNNDIESSSSTEADYSDLPGLISVTKETRPNFIVNVTGITEDVMNNPSSIRPMYVSQPRIRRARVWFTCTEPTTLVTNGDPDFDDQTMTVLCTKKRQMDELLLQVSRPVSQQRRLQYKQNLTEQRIAEVQRYMEIIFANEHCQ